MNSKNFQDFERCLFVGTVFTAALIAVFYHIIFN